MAISEDPYPRLLRQQDERRGRRDGERRMPALAEVRRQQQALEATGGQLTVVYQKALLSELNADLNALFPAFRRTGRAAEYEICELRDRIQEATDGLRRTHELLDQATARLTDDELRPRNPHEQRWDSQTLRNRREVERTRRIRRAQEAVTAARTELEQRRGDEAAAVRRRDEALDAFGDRARRLVELCRRRMVTYLDALAISHPEGKTLYPLLSLPTIPLPDWVPQNLIDDPSTRAGVAREEEEATTYRAEDDGDEADPAEPPTGTDDERGGGAAHAGPSSPGP